jgi:hypothetical protein
MKIGEIQKDIKNNLEKYTTWFRLILENKEFLEKIESKLG